MAGARRSPGRRRARGGGEAAPDVDSDGSCSEQSSSGWLRIRQALVARLDGEAPATESSREAPASDEAAALVARFVALARRVGTGDAAVAAWAQYCRVADHVAGGALVRRVPAAALGLLVCGLAFMRGSARYQWRFEQIVRVFGDAQAQGRALDEPTEFALLLRALNRLGRHRQALAEAARHAARTGRGAAAPIVRQVIAAHFGSGRPDRAMRVFGAARAQGTATPHVYAAALCGALRAGAAAPAELGALVDELLALIGRERRGGAALRTGLMNELLTAAGKSGAHAALALVLERFAAAGAPLNYTTFGILLRNACNAEADAGELRRTYRLLAASADAMPLMTGHVFAMFIAGFVRHGRIDHALAVLDDVRRHPRARPAPQHLEPIVELCARAGLGRCALRLVREMPARDRLRPAWGVYADAVQAVARDAALMHPDWAPHVTSPHVTSPPLDADADAEAALVVALVRCARAADARGLLRAFERAHERFPRSVLPFAALVAEAHRLIDAHARCAGRAARAAMPDADLRALVRGLRAAVDRLLPAARAMPVPQGLYHAAISAFALVRDHETAQRLYDHMTAAEAMDPTVETFDTLLRSFVRGASAATAAALFAELRAAGLPLRRVTANILIRGLLAAGEPDQAIDVYAYMTGRPTPLLAHPEFRDHVPAGPCDAYTFALLVAGLVDARRPKEAVVLFEDAFAVLGHVPRQLLTTLVARLELAGLYDTARLCLRRYRRRVEDSQPPEPAVPATASPSGSAPDLLPLSYFGYLLEKKV
ncbi:hypothetical protein H4R18_000947 [Coemansia javaensis]|uniref:Pentacotripeptide-repeat region of PRORP domain-containing protein n=1 Tax=Coemansia javaensis TaxID=2761396 RepID=A0A9W8HM30_9FUNG|nr:hypothetical protein H4R18_000947 [Coemansia javaensis]